MKVIINKCFGGFSLSTKAFEYLIKKFNWTVTQWKDNDYANTKADLVRNTAKMSLLGEYSLCKHNPYDTKLRINPDLIKTIETLGAKACSGRFAELKIVKIPNNIEWEINEYDGYESIAEKHRSWS